MRKPRVLIIDDDELVGKTLTSIAEQCHYDVIYTDSAVGFLEQLVIFAPDVIFVDLIMPNIDGMQLIQQLAEISTDAGLVIVSGAGSRVINSSALSAQEHGMRVLGTLQKPFRAKEVRALLDDIALKVQSTRSKPDILEQPIDWFPTHEELELALKAKHIIPHLQPQIDTHSGLVVGFEVLARWSDMNGRLVTPDYFIPLAERNHLIDELSQSLMHQTLDWFVQFRRQVALNPNALHIEPNSLQLAFNLSVYSLDRPHLPEELEAICLQYEVHPNLVTLELTESSAMEHPTAILDVLTRLRLKGFELSIDDFGTGYSSLAQLARLPFSELKVDRSFVMSLKTITESKVVVKSVIDLARSLGITSVAEGVEDEDAVKFLRDIHCDKLQGFHIAKPLSLEDTTAWVTEYYKKLEQHRLTALKNLNILDTDAEYRFDWMTCLARRILNMPTALVSLVDEDRQWFKSHPGLELRETPREYSFCAHALGLSGVYVVANAAENERFKDNPYVHQGEEPVVFYAGCPLQLTTGERVGTLCVMDTKERVFSDNDSALLKNLAGLAQEELSRRPQSEMDELTGLFNRSAFEKRSRQVLGLAVKHQIRVSLFYLDIYKFRAFNASHGHAVADQILIKLAQVIRSVFRQSDLIGRFGGDEICVLLMHADDEALFDATDVAKRIQSGIDAEINSEFRADEMPLSIDLGCASLEAETMESLFDLIFAAKQSVLKLHR